MADNVQISAGSGTTIATDECTINAVTVQVQRNKIGWGVDGSYVDASATNPLPVTAIPPSPAAASYLPVRITDGTSFIGSGTEYTEGDTATTPKGSAVFWVSGTTAHAVSTANPLPISDAGGSLTVDGTVAATQSGTWTVTGAAGTFPVTDSGGSITVDAPVGTPAFVRLSDGTSAIATLPVSLASVPSHAVTNAGTFAVQATGTVTANIGTSGSLALDASVTGLQVAQASATSGQKGNMILGAVTTAAPAYTTAQTNPLSLTTAGALRVDASATTQPVSLASLPALATGSNAIGSITNTTFAVTQATGANLHAVLDSGTLTTVSTVTTCSTVTNLAQLGGAAIAMGTGVRSAGTQRVTIATDDVVPASQSGTWTVQPGNTPNTSPWLTTDTPATSGGLSFTHITAAATNNKTQIKATAGQLFAIHAINLTATTKYIKVFNNTSAGVTAGTTSADYQFPIPANGTTGAGFVLELNKGVAHSTGITVMITGALSLTDNTSLAAGDVVATFFYK